MASAEPFQQSIPANSSLPPAAPKPDHSAGSILSGDISQLPVPELIQFFHIQGLDGVLLIEDPAGRPLSAIYFQERTVVHALCEDLTGRKAVYRALTLASGRFRFLRGLVPGVTRSVRDSVRNLLVNKADGRKSLRQLITGLRAEEKVFLDELRLLVRTRWLGFAAGEIEYLRFVEER